MKSSLRLLPLVAVLLLAACSRQSDRASPSAASPGSSASAAKSYPLRGVIIDVVAAQSALLVKHEDIPGLMPAMTMSFKVDSATLGTAKKGTRIDAELYQLDGEWHIANVKSLPASP